MPKTVMMDELHLRVFVPEGLPPAESRTILRTLNAPRFRVKLTSALRAVFRTYPSLAKTRVRLVA